MTALPAPRCGLPLAGDIIFCGAFDEPSLNVRLQRLLRLDSDAEYGHVAVMCGIDHGVHAMPSSGVAPFGLHQLLNDFQTRGERWRVFRLRSVDTAAARQYYSITMSVRSAASFFLEQSYNYAIQLPEWPDRPEASSRSFCSQLVSRIYERAFNLRPDQNRLSSTVLPADQHSYIAGRPAEWIDVTAAYEERINYVKGISAARLDEEIQREEKTISAWMQDVRLRQGFQQRFADAAEKMRDVQDVVEDVERQADRIHLALTGQSKPAPQPYQPAQHLEAALEQGAQHSWRNYRLWKRDRIKAALRALKRRWRLLRLGR